MERLLSIERLRSVLAEEQRIQRVLRQNYTYVLPALNYLAEIEVELDVAKSRITELEACVDEANGHCAWAESDGKRWKERFEWLVKNTCGRLYCMNHKIHHSSQYKYCNDECASTWDGWNMAINHIAAFADKEMGK